MYAWISIGTMMSLMLFCFFLVLWSREREDITGNGNSRKSGVSHRAEAVRN